MPIGGVIGHAGQHLGDMAHLDVGAAARQLAGHVHQAAEIAGEQRRGAGRLDIAGLLVDDGVGDLGIFDREGAAEAAADVGIGSSRRGSAPRSPASSRRGWSWMPSSRRPEQLS